MTSENINGADHAAGANQDNGPDQIHVLPKYLGRYYQILLAVLAAILVLSPLMVELPVLVLLFVVVFLAVPCLSLLCLVTGVIAMVRIRRSGGFLQGNGYVIASMVTPLIAVAGAASLAAAVRVGSQPVTEHINMWHLLQLGDALLEYRKVNKGSFPPAEQWCDVLKSDTESGESLFYEMQNDAPVVSYALNIAATKSTGELPADLVLLFPSAQGWNHAGGSELLPPAHGFAGRLIGVYLASGETLLLRRSDAARLRWTADGEPEPAPPMPAGQLAAAGALLAAVCAGIILLFRRQIAGLAWHALVLGVLAAGAGALCGLPAEALYSLKAEVRIGVISGAGVGFLAGVCFVLVLGYARERMRPGMSMVGFATVAGAITGAAASTAVHVFLMIGYNDWHVMYPLAGAGFGIWAGILLGWICSGIVKAKDADATASASACLAAGGNSTEVQL